MTTFQYISLIPPVILYAIISYGAFNVVFRPRLNWEEAWVVLWVAATGLISIVLPVIAFTS